MLSLDQIEAEADRYCRPAPSEDEFDIDALNEAYEAYFDATTGGSFGGVRAAIKAYLDTVAARSDARAA
jgi:hypothetical protein